MNSGNFSYPPMTGEIGTPSRQRQVPQQMDLLEKNVHVLEERLQELITRLAPVLSPDMVARGLVGQDGQPPLVGLASRIHDIGDQVNVLASELHQIIDRIEI